MSASGAALGVYIVKVSDVSCSQSDSFDAILDKASKFYSSFVSNRSFLARRDDLDPSDRTWAILCFRNKDDAVKCAQWLLNEPVLSGDGRSSSSSSSLEGRVQVFHRLQAPSKDLETATAEAKKHAQEVSKWEQANKALLSQPSSPSFNPGNSRALPVKSKVTSPQGTVASGDKSKKTELPPHSIPILKHQKPLMNASPKAFVATEKEEAVVPVINEQKISKSKEMIAEGLGRSMNSSTAKSSKLMRSELANSIVEAILALKIDTHEFSEKIRHLQFNLGKNADLRTAVLEGTIAPEILATMRSEEMKTKEQAEKRKQIEEKSLETHVLRHADLEFGFNIDAALQLKREAKGYKEPRYSDADTLNNSNGLEPQAAKSTLLPPSTTGAAIDNAHPDAQKRVREEQNGNIINSDSDLEGTSKRAKKSVKFDAAQTDAVKNSVVSFNPQTGVLRHHPSLGASVSTPSHHPFQQIDWGPPIQYDDPHGWQPPPILATRGSKIYNGNLAWESSTGGRFNAEVEVVGYQPYTFIRLPHSLDILESVSFDEMRKKIEKSGAKSWHLHRAWIVGPKMPDVTTGVGIGKKRTVGRILMNNNGEVLKNYNEGWEKSPHLGWELFIMEPTVAACETTSALLQEGAAARKSHALLMIAVPHYWGEWLPLGESGIRHGLAGSRRIYVSASGATTLHKLPKVLSCDLRAHRSRMNLSSIWDTVFFEPNVRLYPRQEDQDDEEDVENVAAFDALEKRLRPSPSNPYGADALICQQDIPTNIDLAVASGGGPNEISGEENFLLLGCWNRRIIPRVGHTAMNFREVVHSWIT